MRDSDDREMVAVPPEEELSELYAAISAAMADFAVGRPEPFQALWSPADDVTIFGAFGGHERGWSAVGPRLAWAASQFASGHWAYEPISASMGADIGYTVGLERSEAIVGGDQRPTVQHLRVTHVFRREGDAWKIVHRHADGLTHTAAPSTAAPPRPSEP